VVATALPRLPAAAQRRRRGNAKASLVASAKKALAMKREADGGAPASRKGRASTGLAGKARITVESHVPRSTRGRVRKQVARAQAKRDSRPR
jgi:hypothetical protein